MKTICKAIVGTAAAGAVALASAAPAAAEERRHRDRNGISTGEVIAGAVILGGIAAILSSSGNNNDRYDRRNTRNRDRDYRGDYRGRDRNRDYRGRDGNYSQANARRAVERCVRAAERRAQRWSGNRAEVYEIRDVDRERGGFEIKGRIAVRENYRNSNYRNRDNRGDYRRGYSNNGWDEGRFTCEYRRGRVSDVRIRGIRSI